MRILCGLFLMGVLAFSSVEARDVPEGLSKALEQLDFANGLFERQMYSMALNEYRQIVENFSGIPEVAEAYLGIGESQFFLKESAAALDAYEQYLQLNPSLEGATLAKLRVGQSLVRLERFEDAVPVLDQVEIGHLPESQRQTYFFTRGQANHFGGSKPRAMESYFKVTEIDDTNALAVLSYLGMGDVVFRDQDYVKAAGFYGQAYDRSSTDEQKSLALFKKGEAQSAAGMHSEARLTLSSVVENFGEQKIFRDALQTLFATLSQLGESSAVVDIYVERQSRILKNADFLPVQLQVAQAYAKLQQYDEAMTLLGDLLKMEGLSEVHRRRLHLARAKLLSDNHQHAEALEVIESSLSGEDDMSSEVQFLRAEAYYGLGRFEEAVSFYRQALEQTPDSPLAKESRYGLAFALHSLGKHQDALDEFIIFFKTSENPIQQEQALHNIILLSARLNLVNEGISYCQIYLTRFGDSDRAEQVLYFLGGLYGQSQQLQKACDIYKQYVLTYPDSSRIAEIYFLLAYYSQSIGQYEQAVLYYQKAAVDDSDPQRQYSSLKNLAVVYLTQDRPDDAVHVFSRLLGDFEANDLPLDTYLWLAENHLTHGRYQDVLNLVTMSAKNPDLKDSGEQLKFFQAEATRFLEDYSGAEALYDQVLAAASSGSFNGEAKLGKALSRLGAGFPGDARTLLAELIAEFPEQHTLLMKARFALGEVEEKEGRVEEAVKYYMLVAVLYQSEDFAPRALFRAGLLMESMGKESEAMRNYEEILTLYPRSEVAEKARERREVPGAQ